MRVLNKTSSTISMFACYKVYAIRYKVWSGCALFCYRVISSTRRLILYIYIFFKFTLLVNNTITPLSVRNPVYHGKVWEISTNNTIKNHAQTFQWCHNERDGVSKHQPQDSLFNHLFRHRSKKTQRASNAENVSIWWRHHEILGTYYISIIVTTSYYSLGTRLKKLNYIVVIHYYAARHMWHPKVLSLY